MTNSFYTNVQVWGSRILYRGVEEGRRIQRRLDYSPTLFVPSQTPTEYTTLDGKHVAEMKPGNIKDCRDFVKKYEDVSGFTIYGNQRYEYQFISDEFPDDIEWDIPHINIGNIDIEVGSENGFPEPDDANEPITAITFKSKNKFIVLGCGEFQNTRDDVWYIQCRDEIDLIKKFLDEWAADYPDIVTGWNVKFFDIPYLINRITKLLGEETARRLSPWSVVNERFVNLGPGRQFKTYTLLGLAVLDYIDLYQRYAPEGKSQESYKLDAIANVELDERKLSYEEYGNLHTLYKDNYQLFIEYNIRDVELIDKLEDKLNLIKLVLTLSYDNKCNYEDAFAQVRMWDVLIYNFLKKKNIVVPPNSKHYKEESYDGAHVKEPVPGFYKWIASFDLDSLYPHLIMQWNISPETLIEPDKYTDAHRSILSRGITIDGLLNKNYDLRALKELKCTLAPNEQFFRTDKQGFLAKMMEDMYNGRKAYKKKSIEAQKLLEKETDPEKKRELEKQVSRFHNMQLAKKVSLNSAYGALGNEFFRFFDVRMALAVTTAGQLAIRWIEQETNRYFNKLLKTEDKDYVIAADTDSMYLSLDLLVSKTIVEQNPDVGTKQVIAFLDKVCENKIQPFINKVYDDLASYTGAYAQKMRMKREVLADKGIWVAKKRYILNVHNSEGIEYAEPKIKVKGLEMVKSSTPSSCRKMLKESVSLIFNKTEDEMIKKINVWREEFKTLPVADIAFPRGVNGISKDFNKGVPIHVRGTRLYNELIVKEKLDKTYPLIKEGEKIKFIYLKEPNTIQSNIIAFPVVLPKELDLHRFIDYDVQFEKAFLEPLKIILNAIGWKTEKTSSLEDFFK
jgi:DNA polymerase elongation subunit (family B)